MHEMMKKMKKEGHMPEHEKHAKMSVLSHLRDLAQQSMGDKLDGVKKVSVMSNSSKGLESGLEKAHEIVKHNENDMPHDPENNNEQGPEHMEMNPHGETEDPYENLEDEEGGIDKSPHDMDHNELGKHIAKLQALHHSMKEE